MLLIECPWCGPRNEDEFLNGGEADSCRPDNMTDPTDRDWYHYVYCPSNPKGWLRERWWHARGCKRWFKADRSTHTHEMRMVADNEQWR